MDKDFAPSPNRSRRCIPTSGASSNSSRIPGLSTRSHGAGGLAALSPILKKEACLDSFMQESTKQIPSARTRGIPRPNSRLGPPKETRKHEVPTSCPLPSTSQSLQWTTVNGLAPRNLSSLSFTLRRNNNTPTSGRQLLSYSMTRREIQKVPLKKEAQGTRAHGLSPSPLSPSGLQTLPQNVAESGISTQAIPCHEGENHTPDTEMPDSKENLAPVSSPSPPPHPHSLMIGKDPVTSTLKTAVKEDPASNDRCGIPKAIHIPEDLAEARKLLLSFPQECLDLGHPFMSDSTMSPVKNAARCESKSKNEHLLWVLCGYGFCGGVLF